MAEYRWSGSATNTGGEGHLLDASAGEDHAGGRVVALHKVGQPVGRQIAESALGGNHGLGQAPGVGNLMQALHGERARSAVIAQSRKLPATCLAQAV